MRFSVLVSTIVCTLLTAGCLTSSPDKKENPPQTAVPVSEEITPGQKYLVSMADVKDEAERSKGLAEARKLLEAESQTNLRSLIALAGTYEYGIGGETDIAAAARLYKKAAESSNPIGKMMLADFWIRGGGPLLSQAEDLIKSIPGYEGKPAALFLLGRIRYELEDTETAFAFFRKAWKNAKGREGGLLHNEMDEYFVVKEKMLESEKKFDQMLPLIDLMEEFHPESTRIAGLRGDIAVRKNDFRTAEKEYRRTLAKDRKNPMIYRALAIAEFKQGRFEDAFEHLKIAAAITPPPADFTILILMNDISVKADRTGTFLKYLNDRIRQEPSEVLMVSRANLHMLRKEYGQACQDFEAFFRYPGTKENLPAVKLYSSALLHAEKFQRAAEVYTVILAKEFDADQALDFAEMSLITGNYAKTRELAANPEIAGSKDDRTRLIGAYLDTCACILSSQPLSGSALKFQELLKNTKKTPNTWDSTLFRGQMKTKQLPAGQFQKVMEATDAIDRVLGAPEKRTQNSVR